MLKNQLQKWTGAPAPRESVPAGSEKEAKKGATEEGGEPLISSHAAQKAQANAELLQEMFAVIFMKPAQDRGAFGNWLDTLNQGASLEGVYNAFTHSSQYRQLEAGHPGASPRAIKTFGRELARLQTELPQVTRFREDASQPLPVPVQPTYVPNGEENFMDFGTPEEKQKKAEEAKKKALDLPVLAEEYSAQFIGASIFTLKRILGDEVLKVIAEKSAYREKFALWYGKWAATLGSYGVDFGLPKRNLTDEKFHYQWALKADPDRLRWEVLNRVHRLLNEANKIEQ